MSTSSGVSGLWYNEGMQRLVTSDLNATFWHRHYLYSAAHFVILSGVKCRMFDHVKAEQ